MGKKKDTTSLKEIAQMLFLNANLKQKEIATKLGVSEVTVSRWSKAGQWDTLKKNLLTSKHQRLSELYDELEELNRSIRDKDGYRVADSKEADIRRKLIADIKALEGKYSIAEMTTIAIDFCEFVKQVDSSISEQIMELFNAFIQDNIEKQKWQD